MDAERIFVTVATIAIACFIILIIYCIIANFVTQYREEDSE